MIIYDLVQCSQICEGHNRWSEAEMMVEKLEFEVETRVNKGWRIYEKNSARILSKANPNISLKPLVCSLSLAWRVHDGAFFWLRLWLRLWLKAAVIIFTYSPLKAAQHLRCHKRLAKKPSWVVFRVNNFVILPRIWCFIRKKWNVFPAFPRISRITFVTLHEIMSIIKSIWKMIGN